LNNIDIHYNIIFRTCDAVFSVHRTDRPFGLKKKELIKICFVSLYEAVKSFPHHIHIIGDGLSEETMHFFQQFPVSVSNHKMGNDESIRQSILKALELPANDWIYFCEDDYLHREETFIWIDELIRHRHAILSYQPKELWKKWFTGQLSRKPLFVHPPDYPDRYRSNLNKVSLLFHSTKCHWRQISNTTFTFLTQGKTIRRFKKPLLKAANGARDGYLSRRLYGHRLFWRKGLCLSPIPGLATHMHTHTMTPLVEWKEVLLKNKKILESVEVC